MSEKKKYSPRIQDLLLETNEEWKDIEANRKKLIPYGIGWLDLALYGIDTRGGELIVVQGPEKGRKTTFMLNVIANIMETGRRGEKEIPTVVVDTLESGMHPRRYRDAMISLMATRELEEFGHSLIGACRPCKGVCKQLGLSPEFLVFNKRTPIQETAIANAKAKMMEWKLLIYGARKDEGDTRTLDEANERWIKLIEHTDAKIFVIDHIQQYSFRNIRGSFEKLETIVPVLSDLVAQQNVALFALSQVSVGAQKDAQAGLGEMYAVGGKRASQEANTVLTTEYDDQKVEVKLEITTGRKSGKMWQVAKLDKTSGYFYGDWRSG